MNDKELDKVKDFYKDILPLDVNQQLEQDIAQRDNCIKKTIKKINKGFNFIIPS